LSLRKQLPRNLQVEYTDSLMCSQLSLPTHFPAIWRLRSARQGRSLLLCLSWVLTSHGDWNLMLHKALVQTCLNMRCQSIELWLNQGILP